MLLSTFLKPEINILCEIIKSYIGPNNKILVIQKSGYLISQQSDTISILRHLKLDNPLIKLFSTVLQSHKNCFKDGIARLILFSSMLYYKLSYYCNAKKAPVYISLILDKLRIFIISKMFDILLPFNIIDLKKLIRILKNSAKYIIKKSLGNKIVKTIIKMLVLNMCNRIINPNINSIKINYTIIQKSTTKKFLLKRGIVLKSRNSNSIPNAFLSKSSVILFEKNYNLEFPKEIVFNSYTKSVLQKKNLSDIFVEKLKIYCENLKKNYCDLLIIEKASLEKFSEELLLYLTFNSIIKIIYGLEKKYINKIIAYFRSHSITYYSKTLKNSIFFAKIFLKFKNKNNQIIYIIGHQDICHYIIIFLGESLNGLKDKQHFLIKVNLIMKCLLKLPYLLPGAGSFYTHISIELQNMLIKLESVKNKFTLRYVLKAFINAYLFTLTNFKDYSLPNFNYKLNTLIKAHTTNLIFYGFNQKDYCVCNVVKNGLMEPFASDLFIHHTTHEFLNFILKIDNLLLTY